MSDELQRLEAEPTEKPSLPEAIEWARHTLKIYLAPESSRTLRRLVEAGEKWDSLKHYEKTWGEELWTLKEANAEKDSQLQALRRQLDELGKEKAGLEYKLTEMEGLVKMHCQRVEDMTEAYDHKEKEVNKLRSQLAEKERELENRKKDPDIETLFKMYDDKLREKEGELERMREGITKDFFVERFWKIFGGEKQSKPAPTEAEVEKVAVELWWSSEVKGAERAWERIPQGEREAWHRVAHLVIERGYRREE